MNRLRNLLLLTIALGVAGVAGQGAPEPKPRLLGLLNSYTQPDGRILVPVVADSWTDVTQAAVEIYYAPAKLQLFGVRGRTGVEAKLVDQEGKRIVQFWVSQEARQSGTQVLGYLEFRNLRGREYAEVLMLKGWVNGANTSPGAARIHSEPRTQFVFLPGGEVAIPVWGGRSAIKFDASQLEYAGSYPDNSSISVAQSNPAGSARLKRGWAQQERHISLNGFEDDLVILFFKMLETEVRQLNEPLRVFVGSH